MTNEFYGAFDLATLEPRPLREGEHRSPFQIDRDRIIHTEAFRSLQSKTQVFLSGQYDFYRTRLTHSIEAAQIGRSICAWLNSQTADFSETCRLDPDLVEAACLAHDLGHPPFGHCGEWALNRLMYNYGGFEGNAQTVRLLSGTIFAGKGMAPTRAFLDSILKYKTLHAELDVPERHFLYTDQAHLLEFVHDGRDFPAELTPGPMRNQFRSVECQIMDWADDTAYSLHDLADGIQAGFITIERLERWAAAQADQEKLDPVLPDLLQTIREERLESRLGKKIGDFVRACSLEKDANFLSPATPRYRYLLTIDEIIQFECEIYKRIALDLVFKTHQLQQLDHKAEFILQRLFHALADTYLALQDGQLPRHRLLQPAEEQLLFRQPTEAGRARILCDVLARMTDGLATRTYKRLFDPSFGSIADLV
jgi:dGTPase